MLQHFASFFLKKKAHIETLYKWKTLNSFGKFEKLKKQETVKNQ